MGRVKVGTAEEILSELATSGVFPSKYLRDAIGGFGNDTPVRRITLDKDIIVFQYRTRESDMTPWFTTTYYKGIDSSGSHYNAIRYLALPNRNDATGVYVYRIPAGQEIVIGKVTNQLGNPDFHSNAIGGGFQIYSPNMGAAKELKK